MSIEDNKNQPVKSHRSVRACIGNGYQLYMGNFYRIFRSSWIAALVYALVCSLVTSYFIAQYPKLLIVGVMGADAIAANASKTVLTFAIMGGGVLLMLLATVVLASYGVAALREHRESGTIRHPAKWYGSLNRKALARTLQAIGWWLLLMLVGSFVVAGVTVLALRFLSHIVGLVLICLTMVALLVALLPLSYTFMRYLLAQKAPMLLLLKATYAAGFRYWGAIFMVALVVDLVTLLLMGIIELPANILYMANVQSQLGLLMGDPLGMPSYMGWMNLVVFAISGFIQAYVLLSTLFPYYYLCDKIEASATSSNIFQKHD